MTHTELCEQLLREAQHMTRTSQGPFSERIQFNCLVQLLTKSRIHLLTQLTHMIVAAHQQDIDINTLFFICPATQVHLHELFRRAPQNTEEVVLAVYPDGRDFKIRCRSLVYLVLAGNLIAELLGLTEFMLRVRRIADASNNRSRADALAADWSNIFEQYRQKREGGSAHERQFIAIAEFLNRHYPSGDFTYLDIHSQHVLNFWEEHGGLKSLSLQRYSKVHQRFVGFVEQFSANQQALSPAETDSDGDQGAAKTDAAHLGDLAALPMYACNFSKYAHNFVLSALRRHCFLALENKLIEMRREGIGESGLEAFLSSEKARTYIIHYSEFLRNFARTRSAESALPITLALLNFALQPQIPDLDQQMQRDLPVMREIFASIHLPLSRADRRV